MNLPADQAITTTAQPSHADDLARLLAILSGAPAGGLSIEEIRAATRSGETWSFRTINALLCDLGGRVRHAKIRVSQARVTKYELRKGNA